MALLYNSRFLAMSTVKSLKVIGITCTQVGMDLNEKANSK